MKRLFYICCVLLLVAAPLWAGITPEQREAEIRSAVMAYVQQKTAALGCEIKVKRLSVHGLSALPTGALDYEVVAQPRWEGWGGTSLAVIVRKQDRVVANATVRVEIEALADTVVTTRQIDYGTVLVASDLAVRRQNLATIQGRYLSKVEDAIGKKVRITLRPNATLRSDQLERVPLIKSGQMVTIVAENDRIRITVTGKARSAGAEGDTIIVQNLNSLKDIQARVIDATTVQVVF